MPFAHSILIADFLLSWLKRSRRVSRNSFMRWKAASLRLLHAIVLTSLCGCLLAGIFSSIRKFSLQRTDTEISMEQVNALKFPAVYICSLISEEFIRNMSEIENAFVREAFHTIFTDDAERLTYIVYLNIIHYDDWWLAGKPPNWTCWTKRIKRSGNGTGTPWRWSSRASTITAKFTGLQMPNRQVDRGLQLNLLMMEVN